LTSAQCADILMQGFPAFCNKDTAVYVGLFPEQLCENHHSVTPNSLNC